MSKTDTLTAPDELASLRQRLARLEENGDAKAWPPSGLPAPPPDAKARKDAAAKARRVAVAQAEEDRILAERAAAEEAARVAEIERQRLWLAHEPAREKALADLKQLAPVIAEAEDHVAELHAQRSTLRTVAQRYGRPAGT